jgi:hypothetical protein
MKLLAKRRPSASKGPILKPMSTLNDEDRENLAAFLDGELDEKSALALEAKLNLDPAARQEVEALRLAWSMLDFLPRPEPSPAFTHRTMERLTTAMPRAVATAAVPIGRGRWLVGVVWAAAVLLGVTLGAVAGVFLWQPDDPLDAEIARNGRLIEHLSVYQSLIDFDFLKSLDLPELFGQEAHDEGDTLRPWKAPLSAERQRSLAHTFLNLPATRREQLVKLDKDLFAETEAVRERLLGVAYRYKVWFDHQAAKEREMVASEPAAAERLVIVKNLRKLTKSWDLAVRFWDERNSMVTRIRDLPRDVFDYYHDYLKYMLSDEEKKRLIDAEKAEDRWPRFMQTFVELADRHPPALRGPDGPKKFAELPKEVQEKLKIKAGKLKTKDGWPFFALAVTKLAAGNKLILPNELWPTSKECLNPPMRKFLETKLNHTVLTGPELRKLDEAKGHWPDYPEAIEELAKAHKLHPPWFTLPGPRERWDIYRLPKVDNPDGPR